MQIFVFAIFTIFAGFYQFLPLSRQKYLFASKMANPDFKYVLLYLLKLLKYFSSEKFYRNVIPELNFYFYLCILLITSH
jgi:hypothetical protein